MNITIIGAGYVGLVTGVCLASVNHDVIVLDIHEKKVDLLKQGISPIYEPGLEPLLKQQLQDHKMTFTTDYHEACNQAEIIILAVGTPSKQDGSSDLSFIKSAAEEIGAQLMKNGTIIVTKSTVPVGTNKKIKGWIQNRLSGPYHFSLASNPEFLREGSAIHDTFDGDRIVIGADSQAAAAKLEEMHRPFNVPVLHTSIESAEMIKYASNAFLATKISFINEIANICEKLGGNIEDVAHGMGMDSRIGPHFLQAGIGYGGSCFPKDTNALVQLAGDIDHKFELLESVIKVNAKQQVSLVNKAREHFGSLSGKKAGVLGLSFKPNTDDIREAASIEIVKQLLAEGVAVTVYDPVAIDNARSVLGESVSYGEHLFDSIEDQDMLFIATEWEEFKVLRLKTIAKLMKNPAVFDGRNCFSLEEAKETTVDYYSVGRPAVIKSSSLI
ncbi:UDP-glucose/GDP-mannose dehydrogenase family protein [Rossellomorea oryzaecorticis]|uniref:UDP-glucose 6-dehydrogenase n=1 Tax=Rossellomorea oryzaecorticis TaxID=1396505 RepID=A0ABU9K4H3_9BACI